MSHINESAVCAASVSPQTEEARLAAEIRSR